MSSNNDLARNFLDANTPLYVVRQFRRQTSVVELSRTHGAEFLLRQFANAMNHKPKDVYEEIEPYMFVVALFLKQDKSAITRARALPNPNGYKWISEILSYLEDTTIAVNQIVIDTKPAQKIDAISAPVSHVEVHR